MKNFKDYVVCSVSRDNITVTFENLNEGYSGDYNENDPDDKNLLRFTVYKDNKEVDDASYCTTIPVTASISDVYKAAEYILNEVYWPLRSGYSIKKLCETLSWISV